MARQACKGQDRYMAIHELDRYIDSELRDPKNLGSLSAHLYGVVWANLQANSIEIVTFALLGFKICTIYQFWSFILKIYQIDSLSGR